MSTVSSQPGDLVLPLPATERAACAWALPEALLEELYAAAKADLCGLTVAQFGAVLGSVATRLHCGQPAGAQPTPAQQTEFFRGLQLADLALAAACAEGIEAAWRRFLELYRDPVTRAAVAIAGDATAGHELAGSLYGDLYGLKEKDGVRRSPLASYSGRGSLMGWLRTTLAQRHVDRHRRTHRETPLEGLDAAAAAPEPLPGAGETIRLAGAVSRTLAGLTPEDRYLLASYYLDRRTLGQIGRLLQVHEATISRRLKRLTEETRKLLLRHLQAGGMSRQAAQEALGTDPRDLEINLRHLLQGSQTATFYDEGVGPGRA